MSLKDNRPVVQGDPFWHTTIRSLNLPSTWYVRCITGMVLNSWRRFLSQAGTIEDVKAKAEQLAKDMGN